MRSMKDSGIEWEPNIPKTWETRKAKYYGVFSGNGVDKKIQENEPLFRSVHYMDVYRNSLHEIRNSAEYLVVSATEAKAAECALFQGDVVLTSSSETPEDIGHSVVIAEDLDNTLMGYHLMRFRPTVPMNLHFSKYLFGSHNMRSWFEYRSSGITRYGLSYSDYSTAHLILPPLNEQNRIADFLDAKCAQIDAIIEKQRQVIKRLKAYKLSVITEAVTKGLDLTVPMKGSGVEWVGEIPETWKVTKIGHIGKTSSGATPLRDKNEEFFDGAGIRWVRTLDLNDGLVFDSSEKITELALQNSSCSIMPKYTVCVAMYGGAGTIGKCGIIMEPSTTNQAVCSIVCNKVMLPLYLLFQVQAMRSYWMKYAVGTRKDPNISQEIVASMKVVIPEINAQLKIIEHINRMQSAIDGTIGKKQTVIAKLTDYKKSLIYEAVTGKMEV